MGSLLARGVVRYRWAVVALWVGATLLASGSARRAVEALSARGGTLAATESSLADSLLRTRFGRPLDEVYAITLEGPEPLDAGAPGAVYDSLALALRRPEFARRVLTFKSGGDSTLLSVDRRSAFLLLGLAVPPGGNGLDYVDSVRVLARETVRRAAPDPTGYRVHVTGESPLDWDLREVSAGDSERSELRLAPLTLLVLVVAFGAFGAAVLPIVVGFLAIWSALAVITVLAGFTSMSVFVLNITTMLGLGVGIDYSLLIVTRFREELRQGLSPEAAAVRAADTAGTAAFTSGLTVLVGFAALLLTPMVETRSLGIGGMVVVAMAVLLSTTLLPAGLALLGPRIDWPGWLSRRLTRYRSVGWWERWTRRVTARPWVALVAGGIVIVLLSLPAMSIRIGLPARHWWPGGTDSSLGMQALERIGAGSVTQPIHVVVELPPGRSAVSATALRGLQRLGDSITADPRVKQVRSVADPGPLRSLLALSILYSDLREARERLPDFLDSYLGADGRTALVDVILRDSTALTSAMDVVRRVRALARERVKGLDGARVVVGGFIADTIDLQDLLLHQFPVLVGLILGVTGLMLAVAFRSILVPVKAILLNLGSVAASFGLIVVVFQWGLGARLFGLEGPTVAVYVLVPILVFAIVFGLSMDYEVFLLSRIREAYRRTGCNDQAVAEGLGASAGTITSAALIMILVFGAFAFARVFVVQVLGFGLAAAVLLDATIIRLVLAPAIMQLAGRWNWWPGAGRTELP